MKYADRIKRMKASELREMLRLLHKPGMISFGGGMPSPDSFPVSTIKRLSNKVLNEHGPDALQYCSTEGYYKLREEIVKKSRKDGIKCDVENVIVTSGSQQVLDLTAKIFLNPNDYVFLESPTYLGALIAFNCYQPKYIGIPMDEEGMITEKLEKSLKGIKRRKMDFVYTVPTFQNPTGVTMSNERRKHLLEIADEHDLFILEDDAYSDLRYSGKPVRSIKSMDKNNRVIYTHTFSKTLAPGFRLGYVIADIERIKKICIAKQAADLCTNSYVQYIAYEYIREGLIEKQLKKIKKMYKKKMDVMLKSIEKHFPKGCEWTTPQGGMYVWVTLPSKIDTRELFDDSVKNNVLFVHGSVFRPDGKGHNTMRLNFTNQIERKIEIGIKRLGNIIEKRVK
ncbi:MAG: PLP-dependent aminotransferase family protein [Candidatus Aenigmarchaeota archaeon]|nr:PLP-dependent aminotransferase family protein [Candidatus Aenigmarchaeota archaeon]